METERGRWFLKEFARRNRTADTEILLDAIARLEHAVAGDRVAQDVDRLRTNLKEMATAITRTKAEIAAIHAVEQEHSYLFAASEALDAITRTTERATSDILAAAEQIQELAWTLREDGTDAQTCDDLDRRATEIYTACSFQDITAQRIAKVIQTLRYLEGRINAMIALWEGSDVPAPASNPPPSLDLGVTDEPASIDLNEATSIASSSSRRSSTSTRRTVAKSPRSKSSLVPSPRLPHHTATRTKRRRSIPWRRSIGCRPAKSSACSPEPSGAPR